MKRRRKLRPIEIVGLVLASCVALYFAGAFVLFGLWAMDEGGLHLFGCHHKLNPVVSAELVSQEAPLVFYQLMEQPKIEGIKVKLTYEDGSSEIVEAYQSKKHDRFGKGGYTHEKGMFFRGSIYRPDPVLEPGRGQFTMYCVDIVYNWEDDPRDGDGEGLAYCMVEVYAQTGDEYLAGHKVSHTTVTPFEDGTLTLKRDKLGREEFGLVRLLAQESGTYALTLLGADRLGGPAYNGSGVMFSGKHHFAGGFEELSYNMDMNTFLRESGAECYYAQLNANEPVFLRIYAPWNMDKSIAQASLERLPEAWISLGETIEITQPTALRIRGYDAAKAPSYEFDDNPWDGYYVLAGSDHSYYDRSDGRDFYYDSGTGEPIGMFELAPLHPVRDGTVVVPEHESAQVTLRLRDNAIPEKELRLQMGKPAALEDKITTDYRGWYTYTIEPPGIFELELRNYNSLYFNPLQQGTARLTIRGANVDANTELGSVTVIVE